MSAGWQSAVMADGKAPDAAKVSELEAVAVPLPLAVLPSQFDDTHPDWSAGLLVVDEHGAPTIAPLVTVRLIGYGGTWSDYARAIEAAVDFLDNERARAAAIAEAKP